MFPIGKQHVRHEGATERPMFGDQPCRVTSGRGTIPPSTSTHNSALTSSSSSAYTNCSVTCSRGQQIFGAKRHFLWMFKRVLPKDRGGSSLSLPLGNRSALTVYFWIF